MGRRILAIVVAAVLALVGGVMVLLYARNADARAVAANSPTTVYTSSLPIPAGTSIRDALRLQMLTETQIPANGVPAGALTQVTDENASLLALTDVPPGQYVLAGSFGDTPLGQKLIQVPTGKLAVSVALSDPARVGSFVTPGSFLTIFATHNLAATDTASAATAAVQATSVLLDNIQVIGVGGTPLQGGTTPTAPVEGEEGAGGEQQQGASFLVTLAVTPEQATKLVHAINSYTLYAGLRGAEVKVNPKLETTDKNVFGGLIMNILWDPASDALERYRFALGSDTQQLDSAAMVARVLHDNLGIQQVIIGPDVALEQACELAEAARFDRPELGVILLRPRVDVVTLSSALRSGIREVVAADDHSALAEALRRSRELTGRLLGHVAGSSARETGEIITVFSAKGGVGKTTIATNVAVHLASTGAKTLLVDLDLAFGDVAISLQLRPSSSIFDAVAMSGHIDDQGLASLVTLYEPSGLDVICAPNDPGEADRIPVNVVSELLKMARSQYDYIIVDTPPSFTEHVLAACDISTKLILIATLDIPAVKNLRVAIDTLDMLGSPKDARVIVLNKADAKVGLRPEDVVAAIKSDIAVNIPNSLTVPASVNRGVPIVLDDPKGAVSASIRLLADSHLRSAASVAAAEPEPASRKSLFRGRR